MLLPIWLGWEAFADFESAWEAEIPCSAEPNVKLKSNWLWKVGTQFQQHFNRAELNSSCEGGTVSDYVIWADKRQNQDQESIMGFVLYGHYDD